MPLIRVPRTVSGRTGTVGALAVGAALFLAFVPAHRGFFDVGVYYGAIDYWLHDGGELYDYLRPGTRYGFTYPPFAALLMSPITLVDWHPAIAISIIVNVAAAALVLYWLLDPIARRHGWDRRFAFGVAACAMAVFEPVRDTVSFGQVNLVLLALVFADIRLLCTAARRSDGAGRTDGARFTRFAGVGIGLASAVKLTPAIFILYLVVTGNRRATGVAAATAAGATAVAALAAPDASRVFWTEALWDTNRVGNLAYVSNQSLLGVLSRVSPDLSRGWWIAAVAVVLSIWAVRVRMAAAAGDQLTGFALTAATACLISPVTWVHHLVWLIPGYTLAIRAGLGLPTRRARTRVLGAVALAYVLLCSSVVWLWRNRTDGVDALFGSNMYVWINLVLLLTLPIVAAPNRTGSAPERAAVP